MFGTRLYTAHVRHRGLDPARDLVLVKEGFCWPAALVPVLWALWHRLWREAAVFLAAAVGLVLALDHSGLDGPGRAAVAIGAMALIGYIANDRRRAALDRAGFVFMGAVSGRGRRDAERRFLDGHPALAREMADGLDPGGTAA